MGSGGADRNVNLMGITECELSVKDFCIENYEKHNNVFVHKSIDLNKKIFRYMPLEYLLSMIASKELYVPNRSQFPDAVEHGYYENPKYKFQMGLIPKNKKERKFYSEISESKYKKEMSAYNICVSCWTCDDDLTENYLMWKAYGNKSICCCLETTVNDLVESIEDNGGVDVLLSDVNYREEHPNSGSVQDYVFEKRLYYKDEREFRLCVLSQEEKFLLKINPNKLIKGVTLSPFIGKNVSNVLIDEFKDGYKDCNFSVNKSLINEIK